MIEPADKRGGWLEEDCKMVAGVYGMLAMIGLTGAILDSWCKGTESESDEYVHGCRTCAGWVFKGVGRWVVASEGVNDGMGDEGGVALHVSRMYQPVDMVVLAIVASGFAQFSGWL